MTADGDDILIEITACGTSLRVSAVDAASLVEIVFQAPLGADRAAILRLARAKLAWRLAKDARTGRPPARPEGRFA